MTQFQLSPEQQKVVSHRTGHLQVIACAGSGKTEAISRRVAALVGEGVDPETIVAFTFTDRAATELKARIVNRVSEQLGETAKGRLSPMFVGTIHGYCLRLIQDYVPEFSDFEVLDPNRHAAFLSRQYRLLNLASLGLDGHWQSIRDFAETVDIISNELIRPEQLDGTPLGTVYREYLAILNRFHFLTFGRVIQQAVESLSIQEIFSKVKSRLSHLIVDEFQDINPAQDALIRLLGSDPVHVCVVGDDDQSIYQWRGSDVSSIQEFIQRFKGASSVTLATNRRSSFQIVQAASLFAKTISKRLPKDMKATRDPLPESFNVWASETPETEAATIVATIERLHAKGLPYKDIAILYRSVRTSAPMMLDALRAKNIPHRCGGRTGLFLEPEIDLLGRSFVWLVDYDWRPPGYGQTSEKIEIESLVSSYKNVFETNRSETEIRRMLEDWKKLATEKTQASDLITDFYALLRFLGVHKWDLENQEQAARIGTLARLSQILADFEHVTRRGRWEIQEDGTKAFTGGQDRGEFYYQRLANFIQHFARDAYEGFEGEDSPNLDAVEIITVHGAKGLEWPVVFMPSLQDKRFPSSKSGKAKQWIFSADVLSGATRSRYEGSEDEERRLFYVAMTRAKDALYMSHFAHQKNVSRPSRFLTQLVGNNIPILNDLPLPNITITKNNQAKEQLSVSFSGISDFEDCGHRYRLSESVGFQRQIVAQMGYGKAIHHVLRRIADRAVETGKIPDLAEAMQILDRDLYMPFANKATVENMQKQAARLIERYLAAYRDDLNRIWATERSFELHLPQAIVSGRSDVILSHHAGTPDSLAVVDYKTVKGDDRDSLFEFQLQIYAVAGKAEGLGIDAALLHHLGDGKRKSVDISPAALNATFSRVVGLVEGLRLRQFAPKPEVKKCEVCDFKQICQHSPADPWVDE